MTHRLIWRLATSTKPKYRFAYTTRHYSNAPNGSKQFQQRVFSGIQPTGVPHLGNYFGAISHWVALQKSYDDVIFGIVDLHSITLPQDAKQLRENILTMAACLMACGIDPERSILFQQSAVAPHAELAWVLGCLTTMPRLEHLPQWKQKSEQLAEVPFGLFSYPVLQAADILLYKATHVPVGDDQVKHIELARHLAKLFNSKFGTFFPQAKPIIGKFKRIRSLRKPTSKMSKSEPDAKGRIELTDTPDEIMMKCRKAVTDTNSSLTYEPSDRPGVSNMLEIHAAIRGCTPENILKEYQGLDTLMYKTALAESVIDKLSPIREEIIKLKAEPGHIQKVLQEGNEKARHIADKNYKEVRRLLGFV